MQANDKLRVLFCVPEKGPAQTEALIARIPEAMGKFVETHWFCNTIQGYHDLGDDVKKSIHVVVVQLGTTCSGPVLKDQVINNPNLKWVHSLSAGIDGYVAVQEFRDSNIPLTNAKGAFSTILGEFIALGVLYHTKHLERFMQRKADKRWEVEPMERVDNKSMAIMGYGDIGAACAKIAKNGFGMKVYGIKRNPDDCSDLYRSYCDEVVASSEYDRIVKEADFVVGVLPKVADTNEFFNNETTFSKMKSSAVFMNIGRGPTVKEDDLIDALKEGKISGAVLDVFAKEPLSETSELWTMPNVLITPHCAQQDNEFMSDCIIQFAENLDNFMTSKSLLHVADKKKGY